jgi:hypothetical protein
LVGQLLQHAPGSPPVASADAPKRCFDRRLHRSASGVVDARTARREIQNGTPLIAWIVDAGEQMLRNEPLQYPGQRARMHVKQCRKISRRESRKQSGDTQRKPLWSRDTDL